MDYELKVSYAQFTNYEYVLINKIRIRICTRRTKRAHIYPVISQGYIYHQHSCIQLVVERDIGMTLWTLAPRARNRTRTRPAKCFSLSSGQPPEPPLSGIKVHPEDPEEGTWPFWRDCNISFFFHHSFSEFASKTLPPLHGLIFTTVRNNNSNTTPM